MALIGDVSLERFIFFLVVIVATLVGGSLISATIKKYFKLKEKKSWFFIFLPKAVMYSIYAAGIYYGVYEVIRFDVQAFAAAFGIIGLAVAFSSQQTLQNIISGIILFIERQIKEGDYLEYSGSICKVIDVSLRKTHLRAIDGRVIIVPNSQFITGTVVNYSKADFYMLSVTIPIHADADVDKAKSTLYEVAVRHVEIIPTTQPKKKSLIQIMLDVPPNMKKFEPRVYTKEIGKEKTVLELRCWTPNIRFRDRIVSELLDDARIELLKAGVRLG